MSFGSSTFGTSTTTASGSTSIFGASKPTGSLFGSTQPSTATFTGFGAQPQQQQTQQPAQGSTLFGGGQQQQSTTPLFGRQPASGTTTQQQPQTATSLFGGTTQQQPQTTTGAGLFGTTTQQPQAATGTSLFGNPTQQQSQGTTGTPLFGTTTQQQPQTTGTSPFGATAQQQPQGTAGAGLFGSTTQSNVPAQPAAGLFGASTQQPAQQGTGLFGSTLQPQPTVPTLGAGSSLFGVQQSMSISPVQVAGPVLFSKSTKFNDLPDDVKKKFEALDAHIQGRIQISNELKQRKLGQEATNGQELIRNVHKEQLNVASMIQADARFVRDLKTKTEQAIQDTITATRIIDGFKNPHQYGVHLKNYASFPLEFFTRVAKEMQERLHWCKNTIEQIERRLSSTMAQQPSTPQAIASALQAQHTVFVSLAAKTAAVDAELTKVKGLYTQLWRAKTGSMRDPFNDLDRGAGGDFGLESLQVK